MVDEYKPIVELVRGDIPEIVVFGSHAMMRGEEEDFQGANSLFVTRSLLNPWQYIAADQFSHNYYNAIGLALHSGQEIHLQALSEMSQLFDISESDLFCPREYPIDFFEMAKLKVNRCSPSRFHHSNSGKHTLSLAACRQKEWPLDSYWETSHPLQRSLFSIVGKEAGEKVSWLSDNCGLPTAVMTVRAMMRMWSKLAADESLAAVNIKDLWLKYPEIIGGQGRLETELTTAAGGAAIVKEGADGLVLVQSLPKDGHPPTGLWIKLCSGYHRTQMAASLVSVIESYTDLPPVFERLHAHLKARLDDWLRPGIRVRSPRL